MTAQVGRSVPFLHNITNCHDVSVTVPTWEYRFIPVSPYTIMYKDCC
ncbi:hypothetical protein HMPREF0080_01000 [Anaeroglobus geminatus F0357]|uniref:Uncharacterized protein n=1 Tax=Anaeroglobus geminatus F0357 TaxID=861450 RepID=G9YH73_9FIRM|nr:hypothetical protein HMPREF0080_01000 [Anaeroglobus geminatus F0357]